MKLMMLGASVAQLQGIQAAKAMGHQVYTCDYLPHAPGHKISDGQSLASTFDADKVIEAARAYGIDGIMTMGTDQPVYTAALTSEALGLPKVIEVPTALAVTNKKVMKETFDRANLPTVPYVIVHKDDGIAVFDSLTFPVVLKPVDSQGQRGIYLVKNPEEAMARFDDVIAYSREDYILAETYYPHDEVTVSGWVYEGRLTVLSITDRVTFDSHDQLGICLGHVFPTRFRETHGREIIRLSEDIVEAFEIYKGPIYFQMLIGAKGIMINEIACRIGGAYEGVLLPALTGFDLCDAVIMSALGQKVDLKVLEDYDFMTTEKKGAVELFFADATIVKWLPDIKDFQEEEGLLDWGIHYDIGDQIGSIENATARAGYAVYTGESEMVLADRLNRFYEKMKIIGTDGRNHVVHRDFER